MENNDNIWAVLPLKGTEDAKNRLSTILSADERADIVTAMAHDMLNTLTSSNKLSGVIVVSDSQDIQEIAKGYPVEILAESKEKGLSSAVKHAAKTLEGRGINIMLVIHGDIPFATANDIDNLIKVCTPSPSVAIVPCSGKDGTNVMVCSPPTAIDFHYGKNSFAKHCDLAAHNNIIALGVLNEHLAIDIDMPADLKTVYENIDSHKLGEKTKAFLKKADIASRLK